MNVSVASTYGLRNSATDLERQIEHFQIGGEQSAGDHCVRGRSDIPVSSRFGERHPLALVT
jgi:hypothetical protein